MEDLGWEIRLYLNTWANTTWDQQDILPEYKGFSFTKVVNDAGSGSITFDSKSLSPANLALLERDVFFAFCKPGKYGVDAGSPQGTDICFGFVPESIQHIIQGSNSHEIRISGPGLGEILNRSIILPSSFGPLSGGPEDRPIFSGTPIAVYETLRLEAVARNASAILVPAWFTFGGTIINVDSANVSWDPATFMNVQFQVRAGTGLFELLKWAQAFGGFNFLVDFTGRNPVRTNMFAYQSFRKDVSGKVGLHLGRHVLQADKVISRESTMSDLWSSFTDSSGSRVSVFNGDAQFKYGKREFYWTDAEGYTQPDAQSIATKLANSKRAATQTTSLHIAPNVDFRAFIDYDVFDQIVYDNSELGIRGLFQVMGIAVTVQDQTETHEILLETPVQTFNKRVYSEFNRTQQKFKFNIGLTP